MNAIVQTKHISYALSIALRASGFDLVMPQVLAMLDREA